MNKGTSTSKISSVEKLLSSDDQKLQSLFSEQLTHLLF